MVRVHFRTLCCIRRYRIRLVFILHDVFILQNLALITLFFFLNIFNVLSLWYLAGIYLVILGFWLFLDDGGIFIGFLWVIDLGVGLVFFIFILHYSTFTQQKVNLDKSSRELSISFFALVFTLFFFFFFSQPVDSNYMNGFSKTWFFLICWYDYFELFFANSITDLNLLREIYFYNNSFEFFLINLMLFYGIVSTVLTCFMIKRIFSFLNVSQYLNYKMLYHINATYFIRNQNFIKQQAVSTGTGVWLKKKLNKL